MKIATFVGAATLYWLTQATPAAAQVVRSIDFSKNPAAVTILTEGVEVTLQPMFEGEGDLEVVTAIRAPGFQSLITREGGVTHASFSRVVGIGKLSASDPVPSVLLGTFTGGAHCCATLRVITPSAGKLKVIDFEPIDGEPTANFPNDVDGDGTVDFVRQDDRFRYQFASGAGSYSPPVFLNIYKGQIVDVSDQPGFRTQWHAFAAETRKVCFDRSISDRNGACIAYVAAGARLGDYPSYLKQASVNANAGPGAELPEGCQVALADYVCPAGKEIKFFTFETAAAWFLRANGYID